MSISFKFKDKKKKNIDKRITLDAQNNQKIENFEIKKKMLPVKKKKGGKFYLK